MAGEKHGLGFAASTPTAHGIEAAGVDWAVGGLLALYRPSRQSCDYLPLEEKNQDYKWEGNESTRRKDSSPRYFVESRKHCNPDCDCAHGVSCV